ncbi:MAG: peptidylprolyl isomerase [Oscillospiraceae bacterium]|nr:peptidylprolyl isomerase [Oscillospiraceae bacterium]
MKNIKLIALLAAASLVLAGCKGTPDKGNSDSNDKTKTDETTAASEAVAAPQIQWLDDVEIHNFIMPEVGEKIAVINVKDYGTIKIKLFPEDAEKGVENFVGLAEMDYYDELIFHRIIPNFMNQGGDPKGNGSGGKSIWGESFEGGTDENLYHFTGAVAYANSGATSTNTSQFYIVNTPDGYTQYSCEDLAMSDPTSYNWPANVVEKYKEVGGVPFLDGGYTVFGQVFEGMDVVRAMAQVETNPENDKPLTQVMMESVEIVEYTGE